MREELLIASETLRWHTVEEEAIVDAWSKSDHHFIGTLRYTPFFRFVVCAS